MPTIFTQVIDGKMPGRFVWKDEKAVAFLTIRPLRPGHTLVVPRTEIDHWLDLPQDLANHLMSVSHSVGQAIQKAFNPVKVGMIIAGLEVPHTHIHLVPIRTLADLHFANQDMNARGEELDAAAAKIRAALQDLGIRGQYT